MMPLKTLFQAELKKEVGFEEVVAIQGIQYII